MATSGVSSTVPAREAGFMLPPYGGASAIAEETRAVAAEPETLACGTRSQRLDEPPEARPVVHFGEMSDLVGDDVIEHRLRRENEAPGEGERPGRRTTAPAAPGVSHADPRDAPVDPGGERARSSPEFLARQRDEMIAHPPRDMRRRADDADFAIADDDGANPRGALAKVADAMGDAEHRHDCAVGEDRPRGHLGGTGRHPVPASLEEPPACGKRHA